MSRRRLHPFIAGILCLSLLFSRVALAAFACPVEMLAAPAAQSAACEKGESGIDPLCVKSCNDEPQKVEPALAAAIPPSPSSALRVSLPAPVIPSLNARDPALARANAPPPTILFARFLE